MSGEPTKRRKRRHRTKFNLREEMLLREIIVKHFNKGDEIFTMPHPNANRHDFIAIALEYHANPDVTQRTVDALKQKFYTMRRNDKAATPKKTQNSDNKPSTSKAPTSKDTPTKPVITPTPPTPEQMDYVRELEKRIEMLERSFSELQLKKDKDEEKLK